MRFESEPVLVQNPNPKVPLAAVLSFRVSEPVRTRVEISDDDRSWRIEFDQSQSPAAGLPILGMRPDRHHIVRITFAFCMTSVTDENPAF